MLLLVPAVGAQDSDPLIAPAGADMMDPLANISFPPPVYVVRDSVDIRGTANLPGLRNLYIEFRELNLGMMDDMADEEPQWFPATLPRIAAVVDDVLGTWNTASLPDGLYELQLMINTGDGAEPVARVSPIRIENSPPEFAMDTMPEDSSEAMPEDDDMPEESTDAMAEEPADDMEDDMADDMDDMEDMEDMEEEPVDDSPQYDGPYVVITVPGANVRSGDSTAYPLIGVLLEGDTAPIKGVSSWNTGWWYIELPTGRSGFIAPFHRECGRRYQRCAGHPAAALAANANPDSHPAADCSARATRSSDGPQLGRRWQSGHQPASGHLQSALLHQRAHQEYRHCPLWWRLGRDRRLAARWRWTRDNLYAIPRTGSRAIGCVAGDHHAQSVSQRAASHQLPCRL